MTEKEISPLEKGGSASNTRKRVRGAGGFSQYIPSTAP